MGSGAAVTVALVRAFSAFLGSPLPDERVSLLTYDVEKIHHGTPSGIDNTVITYALPVYFVRGERIQMLRLPSPFTVLIADTGIACSTAAVVGDVRRAWLDDPARYEALFDAIGRLSQAARQVIENGQTSALGAIMNDNHALLQAIGVSSPELDRLVQTACSAGASGAKLSGAGRGGNVIAFVTQESAPLVSQALQAAGANRVIQTTIQEPSSAYDS
jgi:mevalonate kinase